MTAAEAAQLTLLAAALLAVGYPLGGYLAMVFTAPPAKGRVRVLSGAERGLLRLVGSDGSGEDWREYATHVLILSAVSTATLYGLLRLQGHLPLNPNDLADVPGLLAVHTAVSFATSTNWQFYAGESTMSYLSQAAGLAVQNFIAPAVGLAVLVAVVRGLRSRPRNDLGNFWVDFYRALAYVLVPLALLASVVFVSQGVMQTFAADVRATTLEGDEQVIARGPVATQVAIRGLGTNGGGYFNSNAATPFESPNGFTSLFAVFLQLLLPVACVFMLGRLLSRRQAWAILAVLVALVAVSVGVAVAAEGQASPALEAAGVEAGGNMSDKEVRFGPRGSAAFNALTTSTSGSPVDAGLDAFTPAGGAAPLANIFVGLLGGVGIGVTALLLKVLLAVFIGGLLVGRTPEFLGKRLEAREIKLVSIGLLLVPVLVLGLTALSIGTSAGRESIFNPGAHGFTETLYAYTSQANTNGSAFAGFAFTNLSGLLGVVAMALGRFAPIVVVLALAGALAPQRARAATPGTLRTDTPTFAAWLVAVIVIFSGLTLLPALALGPIVEALGS